VQGYLEHDSWADPEQFRESRADTEQDIQLFPPTPGDEVCGDEQADKCCVAEFAQHRSYVTIST
jgi:hypothetical protein